MTGSLVSISVRMKDPGEVLVAESPWAEPVLASDFGGDFRLRSDLLLVPLVRGDVVRCETTATGTMQVVDILQILPGMLIRFEHPRGTDPAVKRVLRSLRMLGHEVCRPFDGCVQVFVPGAELDQDIPFVPLPATWVRREVYDGPFRMRAAVEHIEFALPTHAPERRDMLEHREPGDLTPMEPVLDFPR